MLRVVYGFWGFFDGHNSCRYLSFPLLFELINHLAELPYRDVLLTMRITADCLTQTFLYQKAQSQTAFDFQAYVQDVWF